MISEHGDCKVMVSIDLESGSKSFIIHGSIGTCFNWHMLQLVHASIGTCFNWYMLQWVHGSIGSRFN